MLILKGLGGKANISDIDCCATRLRVTVGDPSLVDDAALKQSGASGVIRKGNGIQIVYGPRVSVIKSKLDDYMDSYSDQNVKTQILSAHAAGTAIPLTEVKDEAFATGVLGQGIAIIPSDGKLYSPCEGKVLSVFDTAHAVNILSDDGCELLLHIGIDTVKLGGKHFTAHVKNGQRIHKSELLISFDADKIKADGYDVTTPMVVCNSDDYTSVTIIKTGKVQAGDDILKVE